MEEEEEEGDGKGWDDGEIGGGKGRDEGNEGRDEWNENRDWGWDYRRGAHDEVGLFLGRRGGRGGG